jgi:ankyrin repeat protein
LLVAAIDRNDARAVRKLLRQGADPNTLVLSEDKRPWPKGMRELNYDAPRSSVSALMRAIEWSDLPSLNVDKSDVVTALVEAGADVNFRATYAAPRLPRWNQAPYLTTPLIEAAYGDRRKIMKILLAHHADVNAADEFGTTALMRVVHCWDLDMTRKLMALGARIDAKDDCGETPLAWLFDFTAGERHNPFVGNLFVSYAPHPSMRAMAEYLLRHGASIHDQNIYGQTIMSLARDYFRDRKLARILEQAAVKDKVKRP